MILYLRLAAALLLAGLLCVSYGRAQFIGEGMWRTVPSAATPVFTATDMQNSGSSGSTITFSSVSFGAAASGRIIIVVVSTENVVATGVTVGGVSATKDIEESAAISGLQIWHALVASGTSGSVVLTAGGSMTSPLILVGNAVGLNSATPTSTNSVGQTAANPVNIPTTVSSGGFAIDAVAAQTSAAMGSWTNATQIYSLQDSDGVRVVNAEATASATVALGNPNTVNSHAVTASWR